MKSWDRLLLESGLPRLEARALLEKAAGRPRAWLIAHGDEIAGEQAGRVFEELAARRRGGEPVAYLTGTREFFGLPFEVGPEVLIPRPETELVVLESLARAGRGAHVLDLGTGSGAIAVTIAAERDDLRVVASDRSAQALEIARRNARRLSLRALEERRLEFREGCWWEPIGSDERFDLVVSNPPYVAEGDEHLERGDLRFEPRMALAGGSDGLDAIRRIVAGAAGHLRREGWLLIEHGHDQGEALRSMLVQAGWRDVHTLEDAAGIDRVTRARSFL